jgi:2-polyprenyl-3-methyl-5-hydroxy-6-metoxy-1,4-benzoquinol methylase
MPERDRQINLIKRNSCPLCGREVEGGVSVLYDFPSIPVLVCSCCGMMFSGYLLAAGLDYYASDFGSRRHMLGQEVNARTNAQWFADIIGYVKKCHTTPKALDVGSGYGYLLRHLYKMGYHVEGVEVSHKETQFAQKWPFKTHEGTLDKATLNHRAYDLVTCFEVIEHIVEPVPFLITIRDVLAEHGILILVTDNFSSDCVKRFGPAFPKWIPHSHVSHFNGATLQMAVQKAGMKVLGFTSFTPWTLYLKGLSLVWRSNTYEAFDLKRTLETEMSGKFKAFHLRRVLDPLWAKIARRNDCRGSLIGCVVGI